MARHQRPRRLRLGHARRRATRRYHGLLDRRAAGAARPHGDAQPPGRAASACPTAGVDLARRRGRRPARNAVDRTEHLAEFRLELGPAGLACTRSTASRSRSGSCCRTARTPSTSPTALLDGDGPVRLEAAAVGPLPRARRAGQTSRRSGPTRFARDREPLRAVRRTRRCPLLRMRLSAAATRRSRSTRKRVADVLYRVEESRGYESRATLWSPGYFRVDLAARRRVHAGRLDRVVGDDRRPDAGRGDARPSTTGAAGCSRSPRLPRDDGVRRRAGAGGRSVHHHAGRPRRGRRPRQRRRRRGRAPSSPATTGSPTGAATR